MSRQWAVVSLAGDAVGQISSGHGEAGTAFDWKSVEPEAEAAFNWGAGD